MTDANNGDDDDDEYPPLKRSSGKGEDMSGAGTETGSPGDGLVPGPVPHGYGKGWFNDEQDGEDDKDTSE